MGSVAHRATSVSAGRAPPRRHAERSLAVRTALASATALARPGRGESLRRNRVAPRALASDADAARCPWTHRIPDLNHGTPVFLYPHHLGSPARSSRLLPHPLGERYAGACQLASRTPP